MPDDDEVALAVTCFGRSSLFPKALDVAMCVLESRCFMPGLFALGI